MEGLAKYSSPRFWPKDASSLIGSIHIHVQARSAEPNGPHSVLRPSRASIDRVIERVDSILRSKIAGLEELTIQVVAA